MYKKIKLMKSNSINFICALLLCAASLTQAQTYTLINAKWVVAEYGISNSTTYGTDPQVKPQVILFSKDSAKNYEDYSNIVMNFFSGGNYQATNISNKVYNGTWKLNAAGDSLTTDSLTYIFSFINPFTFITFNRTIQVVDTLGTPDTLYTYVKMSGTGQTTAISEPNLSADVKVYPIPTKDKLNLEFASKNYKEARLYTVLGQLLQSINLQTKQSPLVLDLENLDSGYYSLEIISSSGVKVVKKIIKD